jgi:Cu/Ag efflux pump CusA
VRLKPISGSEQQHVFNQLRSILTDFPGILFEVNTFLTERIDETISGYTSAIVVNIFGDDLTVLDQKAESIMKIMRNIPGAIDVQLRSVPGTPILKVNLNLEQLAFHGIRPDSVIDTIQAAYEGHKVGKYFQGNRLYNIIVSLAPAIKQQPENIALLPVRSLEGSLINLGQIADITHTTGRYNILHQDAQRKQTVTCNIANRDLVAFTQELKSKIRTSIHFDSHVHLEFTGETIEQSRAIENLVLHSLIAISGVLLLIYFAMKSLRHMLLTLANIPFSFLGGVAAVVMTGETLSVGSMVGFVTLFGITVRNSIMLMSHYQYLVEQEGRQWNLKTALLGAQERLPSILMTALITALAMLPIAFNSDNPGREIMGPMAAIIIGGLATSTLLNLLLLPPILLRYGKFKPR